MWSYAALFSKHRGVFGLWHSQLLDVWSFLGYNFQRHVIQLFACLHVICNGVGSRPLLCRQKAVVSAFSLTIYTCGVLCSQPFNSCLHRKRCYSTPCMQSVLERHVDACMTGCEHMSHNAMQHSSAWTMCRSDPDLFACSVCGHKPLSPASHDLLACWAVMAMCREPQLHAT